MPTEFVGEKEVKNIQRPDISMVSDKTDVTLVMLPSTGWWDAALIVRFHDPNMTLGRLTERLSSGLMSVSEWPKRVKLGPNDGSNDLSASSSKSIRSTSRSPYRKVLL